MPLTELSSNWKKLKLSLANDTAKAHKTPSHEARPLKRKATKPLASAPAQARAKRQKSQKSPNTNNMGAYISSLVSSAPTPDPQSSPQRPPNDTTTGPTAPSAAPPTPATGKYISLDCEMVGTTSLTPFSTPAHYQPPDQRDPEYSILARASLVSYTSAVVYDAYVLPPPDVEITNYRAQHSGITPQHLEAANPQTRPKPFAQVQREVEALMRGRVLVGHALKNDLAVLGLSHPARDVRDTSRYTKYRQFAAVVGRDGKPGKGRTPSLKRLAGDVLGWEIQGERKGATGAGGVGHDSVEDARAAMALFRKEKDGFESEVARRYGRSVKSNAQPVKVIAAVEEENVLENGDSVEQTPSDGEASDEAENEDSAAPASKKKRKKKKKKSKTKR